MLSIVLVNSYLWVSSSSCWTKVRLDRVW